MPVAANAGSWSLVRRLTGGVALVALLGFVAQAWVLTMWLAPLARENTAAVADQALQLRTTLGAVPAAQREALAQQLSGPRLLLSPQQPAGGQPQSLPPLPEFDAMVEQLGQAGVEVHAESRGDEGGALIFRLPVDNEVWWLEHRVRLPPPALKGTLAVWLAMLALAILGALLVSVRLIARPLQALAQALAAQQGRLQPLPLRSDASTELQALVQAFNELVHQVTRAAQARQTLLAGVSHDLRTPLARLRLRAETQCEPALADALTADLLALERIVNQFLAYVQGDGQASLGVPMPLARTVHDTVERYASAGQPVALRAADTPLMAPDLALQRALSNLIDNALAYGGGEVDVELRAVPGGAEIRVSDDGAGMSEAEFERAQQPFVRLTRHRSELGHCGLGLAIVAQMARQLGGSLRSERPAARGFTVVLALQG